VLSGRSLRRTDHSSRGVLSREREYAISVIAKPGKGGGGHDPESGRSATGGEKIEKVWVEFFGVKM